MTTDRESELALALVDLISLVEAWMNGPLNDTGIIWRDKKDHPPALKAARAALGGL